MSSVSFGATVNNHTVCLLYHKTVQTDNIPLFVGCCGGIEMKFKQKQASRGSEKKSLCGDVKTNAK